MNDLAQYFEVNKSKQGKPFYKHFSFAAIYDNLLSEYRGKPVILAEVGVGYGGCLQVWKEYLGPESIIYGIDKEERLGYEEEQIKFILANQEKREELAKLRETIPMVDILIDDGSHVVSEQINTFEELFPLVTPGGLYICEDTHTSYRELYKGGYKNEGSFIEYCKRLIDAIYHTEDERIPIHEFCNIIYSISFYSSMIVIRKRGRVYV